MIKPVHPIKEVKTMAPVDIPNSSGGVDHVYNFKNPTIVEHISGSAAAEMNNASPPPVKHHVEAPHHMKPADSYAE